MGFGSKIKKTCYKIIRKTILLFVRFMSIFVPVKENEVAFILSHKESGNNIIPVIEKIRNDKELDIKIIEFDLVISPEYKSAFKNITKGLKHLILYFKTLTKILTSKIIVTTHNPLLKTKKNITLELWHGIPLKGIKLMKKGNKEPTKNRGIDYINAPSNFAATILNSGFGLNIDRYVVLGQPRNDYLYSKDNSFRDFFNLSREKILFYLPTFRDYCKRDHETFIKNLTFDKFNLKKFNEFLEKNNLIFFIKPHPFDMHTWEGILKNNFSNIKLIFDEDLEKNSLELYKVLGQTDLLITDYSSVYLDYLLTEKPIIFIHTDIKKYRKERKIMLEPYNLWTPGPKVHTQEDLEKEIMKSLNNKDYYKKERKKLKDTFHEYQDNKSSERVAKFITEKIKNERKR